jgi:ribosomal-protein-alanine N-acetyltransferase
MMRLTLHFIRTLQSKDLDRVIQISHESLTERYDKRTFVELLLLSPELSFVEENIIGKVIGFIIAVKSDVDRGRILVLAVDKSNRQKGVGSRLLDKCMETMKQKGAKKVGLEVMVSNEEAIRFYLKKGFKTKNLLPCFYSDGSDGYLMEREV